ncbi:MAG: imidazoleglycerol-phosphate dehydratase HisB [Clostridiales bacterium]|nr:imidazoleglycerol-phosphate dehydratase HisB [Clostridiales bacterium]
MRQATITRQTKETDIELTLNLDGSGACEVDTGCGFLDHMLDALGRHALVDLRVTCRGDTHVDDHHTVEDVGIVLGMALRQALGDKRGIARYGDCLLPMDEALVLAAVDLSGRAYLQYDLCIPTQKVGTFDTELVREFFLALTREGGITLHLRQLSGQNSHHIIEAAFKGCARALRQAIAQDPALAGRINSTKGAL